MQRKCENGAQKAKNGLGPSRIKVVESVKQLRAQAGFSLCRVKQVVAGGGSGEPSFR